VQNEKRAGPYRALVGEGQLTAVRGVRVDAEERVRARIIRDLLCNGQADLDHRWAEAARAALAGLEARQLVEWDDDRLRIGADALPYARLIATQFDAIRGSVFAGAVP